MGEKYHKAFRTDARLQRPWNNNAKSLIWNWVSELHLQKKKKKKLCFVLSWLITFFPEPQQCSTISSRKKNIQVSAHKKTDKPSTSHCQWHTSPQTKPRQGRLPLLKEQQQGVLAVTSQHQSLVLPDH